MNSQARKLEVYDPFVLLFSLSPSSSLCFYFCMASALFPVHIRSFLLSDGSLLLLPPSICFSTTPAGAYLVSVVPNWSRMHNKVLSAAFTVSEPWAPVQILRGRESL